MDGIREFKIIINGLAEAVDQATALNEALNVLERKINSLENKSININVNQEQVNTTTNTTSTYVRGQRVSVLQTEDKLLRDIQKTEEQIANTRRDAYQDLLAQKDILKEVTQEAKERAAAERLLLGNYANTMRGLKEELSDIKKVMQNTDLGEDRFEQLTARAGELTNKLKEIEQSYGQFVGRNVGNYKSAFDDFKKVTIQVGDTTREFNSVRDASRQLTQELKAMVIAGKEDTKEFQELSDAVHEFEMNSRKAESAVNDLKASSKGMDDMLDTMQSLVAIGSVTKGFAAFFGFDNEEIEKSIQKLVALQNVLNGIEKLKQQMNTREGLGKWFAEGSEAIDTYVAKVTGARITTEGLTTASRAATVAVRALSWALKAIGVGLITAGILILVKAVEEFVKSLNDAKDKIGEVDEALNTLNRTYQARLELLSSSLMNNMISDEEYLTQQYKLQGEYIKDQIDLLQKRMALESKDNASMFGGYNTGYSTYEGGNINSENPIMVSSKNWGNWYDGSFRMIIDDMKTLEDEFDKCNKAVDEGKDYFEKYENGLKGFWWSLVTTREQTKAMAQELGRIRLRKFIEDFQKASKAMADGKLSAEDYAGKLRSLKQEMNDNSVLNSVIANLDKYIPEDETRKKIDNIIKDVYRLEDAFNMSSIEQQHYWEQVRIDGMKDSSEKIKAQIENDRKLEIAQRGKTQEQIDLINQKYRRKEQEELEKFYKQQRDKAKQHGREIESAKKELESLRIENMKEGLDKQLAQLDEEKRQKLQKAKETGIMVGEITTEIETLYIKKEIELRKKYAKDVEKLYQDMYNKIFDIQHSNNQTMYENQITSLEDLYTGLIAKRNEMLKAENSAYSIEDKTINNLLDVQMKKDYGVSDEDINKAKEYIGITQAIYYAEMQLKKQQEKNDEEGIKYSEAFIEAYQKKKEAILEFYNTDEQGMDEWGVVQRLMEQNYTDLLLIQYKIRITERSNYYKEIQNLSLKSLEEQKKVEMEKLTEQGKYEIETLKRTYNAEVDAFKEKAKKLGIEEEKQNEELLKLKEVYLKKKEVLEEKYDVMRANKETEYSEKSMDIVAKRFASETQEFRDAFTRFSQIDISDTVRNGLGFTDIAATKKRNKELINLYKSLAIDILNEKRDLQDALDNEEITFDTFQQTQRELSDVQASIGKAMENIKKSTKKTGRELYEEITQVLSQLGSALNGLIGAMGDYADQMFENEINDLQKQVDKYKELLKKQEDITKEHASVIDDIEGELSNARGARRQALIDQLNAEMAAQRASLAEEKRIEKEKQRKEIELDDKERQRFEADKKTQRAQAMISGALAVTNALSTQPIWVGIAMAAMTSAMVAYQIATINAQKYTSKYATGGVIQGRSHAQGGVKVLGGHAEVEGGEYITNKVTTEKNVELLEFVNSKKKKLNLDDMIEFYSGKKVKAAIASTSPKAKYADGGQIPMLRSDITLNDRMLQAFEDYSNRPTVVSVVDILDGTQRVNDVQVMAGLSN